MKVPYIDMHCDTLMQAYKKRAEMIYEQPGWMIDVKSLKECGAGAQFFAIFMLPGIKKEVYGDDFEGDRAYIKYGKKVLMDTINAYPELIGETKTFADYIKNKSEGKVSGILSIEDARPVNGKYENLKWLYDEGIRMVGLTWNFENCFGYPNSADPELMKKGLKPFGKESIEMMNDLGMLIDVSHLSDGGFWDIVELTKKPFMASHSNCRDLSPHQRNLTDEMIRALANKGGCMGLNLAGSFMNEDINDNMSRISQMVKQLKHMVRVGGIETAAIGTDFDGINGPFEIENCLKLPLLFDAMAKEGFTTGEIEKIAYKNVERVLKEVWK